MSRPILHVCVTCRAGRPLADGETAPGRLLHDAIVAEAAARGADPAAKLPEIREVTCLAACERGCTAAVEEGEKWRVLLGNLSADIVPDLLDYASLYADSRTGMVLPSKRAESLRHAVLGRLPA